MTEHETDCRAPGAEAAARFARTRVLVVDDHVPSLTVAVQALRTFGCEVIEARRGEDALDIVARTPVDLVFMDVHLGGLSGIEVTRSIRQCETGTGRHLPIVAVTASAMPHERELCVEAGMDEVMIKPIRLTDLYHRLSKWMPQGNA